MSSKNKKTTTKPTPTTTKPTPTPIVNDRTESDKTLVKEMFESNSNEQIMKKLQNDEEALSLAQKMDEMYDKLKKLIKVNPAFMDFDDKAKLAHFRDGLKYAELMSDHPIVTRYLICMGQYSTKAFRKFLYKIKNTVIPLDRKKGHMEDEWIRRQSDYVKYLWESYQKKHYSTVDSARVWQETYDKLKGEFDDFRNLHKKAEETVKETKILNNGENLKELLQRLKTGKQHLSDVETAQLIAQLKDKLYNRRFKNCIEELAKRKPIEAMCEAMGKGKPDAEVENKDVPKITMIETVDAERYAECDDKYKKPTSRDKIIEEYNKELHSEVVAIDEVDEEVDEEIQV